MVCDTNRQWKASSHLARCTYEFVSSFNTRWSRWQEVMWEQTVRFKTKRAAELFNTETIKYLKWKQNVCDFIIRGLVLDSKQKASCRESSVGISSTSSTTRKGNSGVLQPETWSENIPNNSDFSVCICNQLSMWCGWYYLINQRQW